MNDVTLRELLESKIDALERHFDQRFDSAEQAVSRAVDAAKEANDKAERALERRLDLLNEFRQAMENQSATLMPRADADLQFKAIEKRLNITEGKARGLGIAWHFAVGLVGFLVGGVAVWAALNAVN